MRVFVFEYVSGGGFAREPMVASLVAEGDMMLTAIVRDLLQVDSVQVSICRDGRLDLPDLPVHVTWVDGDWLPAWRQGVLQADAVLPIAPETDGVLEFLCDDVKRAGRVLLNSRASAVALTASKLATHRALDSAGVPVVDSRSTEQALPGGDGALVVKPDRGVGCQDVHLLPDERALGDFLAGRAVGDGWLVQPYVAGTPASLSLLVGDDCLCLLGCNRQRVAQVDDGFVLLGCVVNGLVERATELYVLARRVCHAIDGLWGYVGVDFILTDDGPVVLEVNPRLTTSYVGLSRSLGLNVAELLIDLAVDAGKLPATHLPGSTVHVDLEPGRVA